MKIPEGPPFQEVFFNDLKDHPHTLVEHRNQIPLPGCILEHISERDAQMLNHFDYEVRLDSKEVEEEMESNFLSAKRMGKEGFVKGFEVQAPSSIFPQIEFEMKRGVGVAVSKGSYDYMEDRVLVGHRHDSDYGNLRWAWRMEVFRTRLTKFWKGVG